MVCYHPMLARRIAGGGVEMVRAAGPEYRDQVVLNQGSAWCDNKLVLPCGQCVGCRLERSRQWAIRIMHEASMHDANSFVTLTYDDDHLPSDKSLDLAEFQRFMKRFRRSFGPVRFFHCGEYGDKFERPHYHFCLFGMDFVERELWKRNKLGQQLYTAQSLVELWPFGFSTVGDLTFESAAYVARYCVKKVTGRDAEEHYAGRRPEYATMSRAPGIGRLWYDRYGGETFRDDSVVMRGIEMKPPRYYDSLFEVDHESDFAELKERRLARGFRKRYHCTSDRLAVKEKINLERQKFFCRSYEQ